MYPLVYLPIIKDLIVLMKYFYIKSIDLFNHGFLLHLGFFVNKIIR
jgi:hypothetical protein